MLSSPSPASSMEATGRSGKLLWMAPTKGRVSIGAAVWMASTKGWVPIGGAARLTTGAELRACGVG